MCGCALDICPPSACAFWYFLLHMGQTYLFYPFLKYYEAPPTFFRVFGLDWWDIEDFLFSDPEQAPSSSYSVSVSESSEDLEFRLESCDPSS